MCVTPAAHRQFSCHRNICTDVFLSVFVLSACIKRELIKCQMQIYGPAHRSCIYGGVINLSYANESSELRSNV